MSDIASKNLYALLGNDEDQDPDRPPSPPVKAVDKPAARTGKRNAPADAPVKESAAAAPTTSGPRGGRGGRRDDFTGNERAARDREAGRENNRGKPTDDGLRQDRHPNRIGARDGQRGAGYEGRGRGGRGGRGGGRGGRSDDRHSRTGLGPNDHAKQAAHGWGGATGAAELADENAGEAIAKEEEKDGFDAVVDAPINADGETLPTEQSAAPAEPEAEPEPEDKTKSYADYLAELAQKKLQLGSILNLRTANEGSTKKAPEGKEVAKDTESDYFVGGGGKNARARERKDKNVLVLDHDIQARERESTGSRGGRGGRGGRGRGEGGFRGEGRGRGGRGEGRGRGGAARTGGAAPIQIDETSFPSLGK